MYSHLSFPFPKAASLSKKSSVVGKIALQVGGSDSMAFEGMLWTEMNMEQSTSKEVIEEISDVSVRSPTLRVCARF